ncbi:MAG: hypothetical protein SYNGOMJ08_00046 [Candidatus Syntrophoarchaeum sp. GoM_oil]|nr:MAG: hypothetical protein SYNGOMJ08_00046 [Candidatus Syntrophoarchaeum sp. GoM_oil]
MKCAICPDKKCYTGKNCTKIDVEAIKEIIDAFDEQVMRISASIESKGYMKLTRLEELIEFARQMRFERLGIAFCIGLSDEAKVLHEILSKEFEVESVCCKVCGIEKREFGLARLKREEERHEAMCNPVTQAMLLNEKKTDLNIIFGLCMGHDILFSKYADAPVTTLLVKDRVLAHNPAGAIYSKYHRGKFSV